MAYDRELAERIRAALEERSVREVSMFGGLSFMVDERLSVSANAQGDLMVRCDPDRVDQLLTREGTTWPQMRGKPMSQGWIVVQRDAVESDEDLESWIDEATAWRSQDEV